MTSTAGEPCDAKAVWERLIQAKGGRANLEALQTLLVSKTYTWRQFLVQHRFESHTLYRFPDFMWSWVDYGVPTLGVRASQSYLERGYSLSVLGPTANPETTRESITY